MTLTLLREPSVGGATFGCLYVDGRWAAFTLEDAVREVAGQPVGTWKVAGATAIPVGTYPCVLSHSQRFERVLPELRDVPGFTGIRIHAGNTTADTEGCVLVGQERGVDRLYRSRMALDGLLRTLSAAQQRQEAICLTIRSL